MAKLTVTINNRQFELACDEGQEEHLRELSRYFDRHVDDLRNQFGQIGDSRLFIMAGLMIADQLSESLTKLEDLQRELDELRHTGTNVLDATHRIEESAVKDIEGLAERIEGLARSLHG